MIILPTSSFGSTFTTINLASICAGLNCQRAAPFALKRNGGEDEEYQPQNSELKKLYGRENIWDGRAPLTALLNHITDHRLGRSRVPRIDNLTGPTRANSLAEVSIYFFHMIDAESLRASVSDLCSGTDLIASYRVYPTSVDHQMLCQLH